MQFELLFLDIVNRKLDINDITLQYNLIHKQHNPSTLLAIKLCDYIYLSITWNLIPSHTYNNTGIDLDNTLFWRGYKLILLTMSRNLI